MDWLKLFHKHSCEQVRSRCSALRIPNYNGVIVIRDLVSRAKDKTSGEEKTNTDAGSFFRLYPSAMFYSPDRQKIDRTMLTKAKGKVALVLHIRNIYSNEDVQSPASIQMFVKSGVITEINIVGPDEPLELIQELNQENSGLSGNFNKMFADFQSQLSIDDKGQENNQSSPIYSTGKMQSISGNSTDVNQIMNNSTPRFVPPSQSSTSNSLPSMNPQNNQLPPQIQNNTNQLPSQNKNNTNQLPPQIQNNQPPSYPQIPNNNQQPNNTNQPASITINRNNLQPIQ